MYLSRLQLNVRSREAQRDLGNVHNMHRRVMSAFPDDQPSGARQAMATLYRLDSDHRGGVSLLVQSLTEPNWAKLPADYLVDLRGDNPAVSRLDLLLSQVAVARVYRFRLRANPTRRIRTGTDEAGKRVEVTGFETLCQWFSRKANQSGFVPNAGEWGSSLVVTEEGKVLGHRGGGRLTFGSVLFEGQLKVSDVDAFKRTVEGGIGSAKAFGFGLLSIAPLSGA